MISGVLGAEDIDLFSAGSRIVAASASARRCITLGDELMTGEGLVLERFRELMKATGGRFAEMTQMEADEIVRFLGLWARPLASFLEGSSK